MIVHCLSFFLHILLHPLLEDYEIIIAVCFLWLSSPADYRVTDEALLAETT